MDTDRSFVLQELKTIIAVEKEIEQ